MIKKGSKVKYIGPDMVAYENGKIYTVESYDEKLDMYEIMSELDETYFLPKDVLEEVK